MSRFDFTERTELLIGADKLDTLSRAKVLVFGLGGVGGICADTLVRAGIGHITCIDGDKVSLSNINRQIIALHSTVGRYKTEVFKERAKDINPESDIRIITGFYGRDGFPETDIDFGGFDYVVDCIDDIKAKVSVIVNSIKAGTPVISCMGAGNRFKSPDFTVCDLFETRNDPLARVMRQSLRKAGVTAGVRCVISKDPPDIQEGRSVEADKKVVSSIAYSPSAEGILCASEVIRTILSF